MTDQPVAVVTPETPVPAITGEPQEKKVIDVQAQIDSAVKSRLAREKEKQRELEVGWQEEKVALEEELKYLKSRYQLILDARMGDIPESFKVLVAKMTLKDQVEWLDKYDEELKAKPKPPLMPQFIRADHEPFEKDTKFAHSTLDRVV